VSPPAGPPFEQSHLESRGVAVRGRPSRQVNVVVGNLASPYFYDIVRYLEEALGRAGFEMTLAAAENTDFRPRRWLESVSSHQGDGVILALASNFKVAQAVRELDVPIVLFDTWGESPPGVPAIGVTEYPAAVEAMQHLIALGHRRIAFIGGYEMAPCSRTRLGAYRAALETAGLDVDPDLAREGNFLRDSGHEQTRVLLGLAHRPTAIFVASDEQALGCYQAAYELGLRIPDDLSIIGFDDLDFASGLAPPLTTVRQPFAEMSALAVRTLLRLLGGEQLDEPRIEVSATLVVRGSTASPSRV
jgi:LacI family transcriptional regulator, galactose operon repressor